MTRILKGLVAGSFDPVTNGHVWLFKEALAVVDQLVICAATRPTKKYTFSFDERKELITQVLAATLSADDLKRVEVVSIERKFLVDFAHDIGVSHIFRGIRNAADLDEEANLMGVNALIQPEVRAMFVLTSGEHARTSSSALKSMVGNEGWMKHAVAFAHPTVVNALAQKLDPEALGE